MPFALQTPVIQRFVEDLRSIYVPSGPFTKLFTLFVSLRR
jgi:hypothetical protein